MFHWKSAQLAFTAALLRAPALDAQQNFDTVQVRTERVADRLYLLQARGGNIGLSVGADGAFLVDDQYAPLTPKILAAIRAITDQPVRFVLNTHWHGDHTGGNENLGRTGTVIVAHDNVRRRMSAMHVNEFFRTETPPSPPGALPVVTFNDSVTFHLNGEEIRAHHVRAAHRRRCHRAVQPAQRHPHGRHLLRHRVSAGGLHQRRLD